MAIRTRLSSAAVSAAADAVTRLLDGGTLRIYAGRQPASADAPVIDQTLLAELAFGRPAFGSALDGSAKANEIAPDMEANGGGKATWFRTVSATGAAIFDGTVGRQDEDEANLLMAGTTEVQPGSIVRITELTYTLPMRERSAT
jgi:hypothetical protein